MEAPRAGVQNWEADRRPPCTPGLFMATMVGAADGQLAMRGGRPPD